VKKAKSISPITTDELGSQLIELLVDYPSTPEECGLVLRGN
jgi:hypothetical protein